MDNFWVWTHALRHVAEFGELTTHERVHREAGIHYGCCSGYGIPFKLQRTGEQKFDTLHLYFLRISECIKYADGNVVDITDDALHVTHSTLASGGNTEDDADQKGTIFSMMNVSFGDVPVAALHPFFLFYFFIYVGIVDI